MWSVDGTNNYYNMTTSTSGINFTIPSDDTYTFTMTDSYIDWFPNSCLYVKYIPTWHLVQSYKVN